MSQFLLEAQNISHGFDTLLFHDVNFSLKPSQSAAIIGRSGCGKSTLLHIFSTFIKPDQGSVTLLGKDIYTLDDKAIEVLRRYDICLLYTSDAADE